MRFGLFALVLALTGVALVTPAFAAEEEIVLADGRTGLANVLSTTKDSVSLEFPKKGTTVKLTLPAERLEAHCFYNLRRHHMEDTAENHLMLALFCARNNMWNRGQLQLDMAIALDEAYVEKMKASPGMREGVAESIIESATKFYNAGDALKAGEMAERVLARFGDLPVAGQARTLLSLVEGKRREMAAKKEAAEVEAMDEAAKEEAAKVQKAIEPLKHKHELATKLFERAMEEKNESEAKRTYEAAAAQYVRILGDIDKLKVEVDPAQVERAKKKVRGEAVNAYLKAANIALQRGSLKEATDVANRALKVDPGNSQVQSFLENVETTDAMDDTFEARYNRRRRSHGAPGRVGVGGRGAGRR